MINEKEAIIENILHRIEKDYEDRKEIDISDAATRQYIDSLIASPILIDGELLPEMMVDGTMWYDATTETMKVFMNGEVLTMVAGS